MYKLWILDKKQKHLIIWKFYIKKTSFFSFLLILTTRKNLETWIKLLTKNYDDHDDIWHFLGIYQLKILRTHLTLDLNVRYETKNLLEKNIGENFLALCRQWFFVCNSKSTGNKSKNKHMGLHQSEMGVQLSPGLLLPFVAQPKSRDGNWIILV